MNALLALDDFQREQIKLISKYTPFSPSDVEAMFEECNRDFTLTFNALCVWGASNDRGLALTAADIMDKNPGAGLRYGEWKPQTNERPSGQ